MSSQSTNKPTLDSLKYFFRRPREPLFLNRHDDVYFDIPNNFVPEHYQPKHNQLLMAPRAGADSKKVIIQVANIKVPDLSQVTPLSLFEPFSLFNPHHNRCASKLIKILISEDLKDFDKFFSAGVFARDRVNPYLFVYAVSVAILHRKDTRNFILPPNNVVFPELYLDSRVFAQANLEVAVSLANTKKPVQIKISDIHTATDLDVEHRIAYFREDIGINLHHWHWHLVYPIGSDDLVETDVMKKNRRGELFYYMHQQILARYNFERLSNGLARVRRLNNFRHPIPEGYFPKLDNIVASRNWPARQPYSVLQDLNRVNQFEDLQIDVQDMEAWKARILNDIFNGKLLYSDGTSLSIQDDKGIDFLGNVVEASALSINPSRYGDLHNNGHLMVAYIHDPDNRYLETFGVMGLNTTAMRDPVFYAWHAEINDIFEEHKSTLPAYTKEELSFADIIIKGVEIRINDVITTKFKTFWQEDCVNISGGLDFGTRDPVLVQITHLQHTPFTYHIEVENRSDQQKSGTVRIFMAPKYNESKKTFNLKEQRSLFIELDKFIYNFSSGSNTIKRRSVDSSVTIPFDQTFETGKPCPSVVKNEENFNYCGCGWPQHMLIPKGHAGELKAELFVMITDAQYDLVKPQNTSVTDSKCRPAPSYCGLRNEEYPDRRPMGFPFDKLPPKDGETLEKLVNLSKNMFMLETGILFEDITLPPIPKPETCDTKSGISH